MSLPFLPRRAAVLVALTLFTSLLSCGREITGPGGRARVAQIAFAPHFETATPTSNPSARSVASLVPFEKVRVVLRRGDEIVVDRLVDFPAGADSVALQVTVTVSAEAGSDGEVLSATLDYLDADGVVVFSGQADVLVIAGVNSSAPVEVELVHVGPGSEAVSVAMTPDTVVATSGVTANFTAIAYDAQGAEVPEAIIGFIAGDPGKITIPNLAVGSAQLTGVRGGSWVYAELINGVYDSAWVDILPVPSAITKVSGDAQSTLQGTAFGQPLKVRVTAVDGLGVADWPVNFAVTTGSGLVSAAQVFTDADGFAGVTWTAGDVPGAGSVTASITAPALSAVFTGSQLSSGPSQLVFDVQPENIVAGETLPVIGVSVRNGAGDVITEYSGAVTLALDGGTATAELLGTASVAAVNGVASFPGLTVNRGGTGYRLLASVEGVTNVPSTTFDVSAAPPASIGLVSGGGQSAPALTALASPIVVEVRDQFEFLVPGALVSLAVQQGGGSLTVTSAVTDANGRVSSEWTLGPSGTQVISASVGQLEPLLIAATLVGGEGPAVLFAAYDYTYVPVGRTSEIPVYLSSAVATSTVVTLSTADSTASWTTGTVEIPAGQTSAVAVVTGHFAGQTMAYLSSALGNDSVLVYVDSTWVDLVSLDYPYFTTGDTVRTQVLLGDPAPPGGITVTVRSLNPAAALVAPGSGSGAPVPGCVSAQYCYGGYTTSSSEPRVVTGRTAALLAPPADSALITIPEGQVYGQVVVLIVGDPDQVSSADLTVTAPGLVPGSATYFLVRQQLTPQGSDNVLFAPLGLGQVMGGYLFASYGEPTQDRVVALTSRNPDVVTVDSMVIIPRLEYASNTFMVVAQSLGSTYVVMESPGVPTDSFPVTVANPRLMVEPSTSYAAIHERAVVNVRAVADGQTYAFARASDLPFRVYSNNPAVVVVEGEGGVLRAGTSYTTLDLRFVGAGSAYLVIEAAGHPTDSVAVETYAPAISSFTSPLQVGVGLQQEMMIGPTASVTSGAAHTLSVSSSDPATLRVLTPTVEMSPASPNPIVRFAGVAVGSANVVISGTGFATSQWTVQVTETTLLLAGFATLAAPDSTLQRTVTSYLASGSYARSATDTVRATLRSSDPSVLRVVDSLVTFFPGQAAAGDAGRFIAVQPGSAALTLHSAGLPDSPAVEVTVQPYQLTTSSSAVLTGVGVYLQSAVSRNSGTLEALPVTVTQSGEGQVLVRGPVEFGAGASVAWFEMEGVTPGAVSLILQAANHVPDTLFITVDNVSTRVIPSEPTPRVGTVDPYVETIIRVGESPTRRAPATAKTFVISSSDTTIATVEQDTVRYIADQVYPTQYATVRYRGAGNVILTATDVDGVIAPSNHELYVEPATITGGSWYADDALVLGLSQRTDTWELYVERPDDSPEPLELTLTSSVPGLLDIPATVTIPAYERYTYFDIAAGTTIGSARLTASAPGWNPWQIDVFVTRTVASMYAPTLYVGETGGVDLYFVDALTYYNRPMNVPVSLRVRSERPSVALALTDTVVVPAGESYPRLEGMVTGVGVGTSMLTVEDTRGAVSDLILPGSGEAEVFPPVLMFNAPRYLATPGLRSAGSGQYLYLETPRDSVWVRFTSLGGRVAVADSLLVQTYGSGSAYLEFDYEGLTVGLDSIVAAADGFAPDTSLVLVGPGVIHVVSLPTQTLVVGDSVLLSLRLLDQSGNAATLLAPQTIDFTPGALLSVTNGTAAITSTVVPAGSDTFAVWVRADVAGSSTLSLGGPNFRTMQLTFTTRVAP